MACGLRGWECLQNVVDALCILTFQGVRLCCSGCLMDGNLRHAVRCRASCSASPGRDCGETASIGHETILRSRKSSINAT